jgi:hypothetical protein
MLCIQRSKVLFVMPSFQRVAFLLALAVFTFNEASIYSWAEFISHHPRTPHAVHGMLLANWWSPLSLGVMIGIVISGVPNLFRGEVEWHKIRMFEIGLLAMSLLYLCLFRPISWPA